MADSTAAVSEREPLLGLQGLEQSGRVKKPFFRPRPLWLVPFVIVASMVRGMTLASRVQVFTQLSCNIVHGHDKYDHTGIPTLADPLYTLPLEPYSPLPHTLPYFLQPPSHTSQIQTFVTFTGAFITISSDGTDTPASRNCSKDPAVQAVAARLQTTMAMTVGTLCALSTGWWGHFGERHGRTRVLAAATFGLFLVDLTFILVSTPHTIFAAHGQLLLIIAPIIEGLLGGWSTLQGATSAYVSDCTSDGSRAHVFSRLLGVFFLGLSIGPAVGAFFIRHPIPIFRTNPAADIGHDVKDVTSVFYVAATFSLINLFLVLFVFPESLDKKKAKQAALAAHHAARGTGGTVRQGSVVARQIGHLERLLSPLALFVPKRIPLPGGGSRLDWSLTILSTTLFTFLLSTGIFQIKYLYAEHIYGWGAEQLSYYISLMGAVRALNLLVIMPYLISRFKPKSETRAASMPEASASLARILGKPAPTLPHLRAEIAFDLLLVRTSLFVDFLSHFLVFAVPASSAGVGAALFTLFTSMSSLGAGVHPAVNSMALCVVQMRRYAREAVGEGGVREEDGGAGRLFGALSVLQALGQYILGPMIFGLIYGTTVAHFPKTIFITAAGILTVAIALTFALRPEHQYRHLLLPDDPRPIAAIAAGAPESSGRGRSRSRKDISLSLGPPVSDNETAGTRG